MKNTTITAAIASMLAIGSASAAITVINGDFEDTSGTFANGWTGSATQETTTPLEGLVSASGVAAYQNIVTTSAEGLANFQLDFMVSLDSVDQSQRVRLRNFDDAGDFITLRFSSTGIDRYAGAWGQVVAATIAADTDYYIRINGTDTALGTRSYDVGISTDGISYTTGTTTNFHGTSGTSKFGSLRFESAGGGATWDAVSVTAVPEPSSAALLGLGGIALIMRRRK